MPTECHGQCPPNGSGKRSWWESRGKRPFDLVVVILSVPATLPEATRYYPRGTRGIAALIDAIASLGEGPILCGQQVVKVDSARREVHTSSGECFRYRRLVSTISLPSLAACVTDLPSTLRGLADGLKAQGIRVARIGCRSSSSGLDGIWTYFPDTTVPFYRMTRLERISADLAPPGGAALLFEYPQTSMPEETELLSWLDELGVADRNDVEHFSSIHLPTAYVLFNRGFRSRLNELRTVLSDRGILTAGRYGSWRYSDIEMDIQSAIRAAHAAAGVTLAGSEFLDAMKT